MSQQSVTFINFRGFCLTVFRFATTVHFKTVNSRSVTVGFVSARS